MSVDYVSLAAEYVALTANWETHPAKVLAGRHGVNVRTMHGRIRRARKRGLLPLDRPRAAPNEREQALMAERDHLEALARKGAKLVIENQLLKAQLSHLRAELRRANRVR